MKLNLADLSMLVDSSGEIQGYRNPVTNADVLTAFDGSIASNMTNKLQKVSMLVDENGVVRGYRNPVTNNDTIAEFGGTNLASRLRQPVGNGNLAPYTTATFTARFRNFRKRRIVARDADRTKIRLRFANFTASSSGESISVPHMVIKTGIRVGNTVTAATFNGVSYYVLAAGETVETDDIDITLTAGSEFYECTRVAFPLQFSGQTTNFRIGETVTGGTSGATGVIALQVDNGATGALTLISETGTFQNGEALTGSLGGAATVDLTTTQNQLVTVSSHVYWNEGQKTSQDSTVDWSASEPVVYPSYTATVSGGNITAGVKVSGGSGWSSAPSLYAYEYIGDDAWSKQVGTCTISGGAVTSVTITSGTPPAGLAAWVSPLLVCAGGSGFGADNQIFCAAEVSGIPSAPVHSITIIGTSIERGDSASDDMGDLYTNHGIERVINNKIAVINMSRSSATASNDAQYASLFRRFYKLYMGRTTHALITLGSNDIAALASKSTLSTNINTIKTYVKSFGTQCSVATVIPRVSGTYDTEGGQTAVAGFTAGGVMDTFNADVLSGVIVSDFGPYNTYGFYRGNNANKFRVDYGQITDDGIHPNVLGFGKSAANPDLAAYFNNLRTR